MELIVKRGTFLLILERHYDPNKVDEKYDWVVYSNIWAATKDIRSDDNYNFLDLKSWAGRIDCNYARILKKLYGTEVENYMSITEVSLSSTIKFAFFAITHKDNIQTIKQ